MTRKKLDNRVRQLIEAGVKHGHRSLFVIVGEKGRDQVVILHHILSKATFKARPSVLWCYKQDLGFTSHRKKRMRQLQKKIQAGKLSVDDDNPFDLFVASTQIRYCYYSETQKILGNTFGVCVLQDFEALTPNLLARTIETVEAGGFVCLLLKNVNSLRQLYTLAMDVHARFRTEAHSDVICRFNERFILSLTSCKKCLLLDDQLNVLPLSSGALEYLATLNELNPQVQVVHKRDVELDALKASLKETKPIGPLIDLCKTLDQANAVLKFLDVLTEHNLRTTVSLTAARGRGKSAALGLAIAGAVSFGYSNVFVTSPSPDNLKTFFAFLLAGLNALGLEEHTDYTLVHSNNPELNKALVRVNMSVKGHRQTVQYIEPTEAVKLSQAEIVVIDEAAAIPLPLVQRLLGSYLVFLASTINGYEGTGRSLSLKLVQQLREQACITGPSVIDESNAASGRRLHEITLSESIRYRPGDDVEAWLNKLLCLDANVARKQSGVCPVPSDCSLYYVNRDTLFSFHSASEAFLQQLMAIYVAAHYKNSPNDLQMLADAPAHHIFCLLGPIDDFQQTLPEILCVVQLCLEGEISKASVISQLGRGQRAAGDLIPWTIAQQFQDDNFPKFCGGRIVRIATHPDYQKMGYASRALQLLNDYYLSGVRTPKASDSLRLAKDARTFDAEKLSLMEEKLSPRNNLPPLFLKLNERTAERLDYLGVSFGLTDRLFRFWKRNGYVPVYVRQTTNDITGEHTCIMLKTLADETPQAPFWLKEYWLDFRRRFISLLGFQFRTFSPGLALNVLQQKCFTETELGDSACITAVELGAHLTSYDIKVDVFVRLMANFFRARTNLFGKGRRTSVLFLAPKKLAVKGQNRLEMYSKNLVDHHLVTDLIPVAARLFFLSKLSVHLSAAQMAIILGIGLQHMTVEDIGTAINLPVAQVLALFNRAVRKIVQCLNEVSAKELQHSVGRADQNARMQPARQTLQDDLDSASNVKEHVSSFQDTSSFEQYSVKGSIDEWSEALNGSQSDTLVRITRKDKRKQQECVTDDDNTARRKHRKARKRQ